MHIICSLRVICWQTILSPIKLSWHPCQEWIVCIRVYFWTLNSIPCLYVYPYASTVLSWLLYLGNKFLNWEVCAIDWMFVSPQTCILTSNVHMMVFGELAFGSCLGHEGRALINLINVLIKEIPGSSLTLTSSCEDTVKRRPTMDQEVGFCQTSNPQAPWFWTS